jgi:AraC-like DNA-binding protein
MNFFFPNIKILGVYKGESSLVRSKNPRKNNMLMLKTSGVTQYTIRNLKFSVKAGDIIFIPEGYDYSVITTQPGKFISVLFDANCKDTPPCKIKLPGAEELFERMFRHGKSDLTNALKAESVFFDILYKLSLSGQINYYSSFKNSDVIESAVNIINSEYSSCDFRITSLHEKYDISSVYFCKLFKQLKGVTPSEYLASVRLEKSKELLLSGYSVSECAKLTGFSDPLYFSKVYRAAYGYAPSQR